MDWEALIASSRVLTTPILPADQPTDEALRRAISTAYYAMFHALATSNAGCIVGVPLDPIASHAWDRIYRGLEHGLAKEQLQQDQQIFSAATRHFGRAFGQLQDVRRSADYNHAETFTANLANGSVYLVLAVIKCSRRRDGIRVSCQASDGGNE